MEAGIKCNNLNPPDPGVEPMSRSHTKQAKKKKQKKLVDVMKKAGVSSRSDLRPKRAKGINGGATGATRDRVSA